MAESMEASFVGGTVADLDPSGAIALDESAGVETFDPSGGTDGRVGVALAVEAEGSRGAGLIDLPSSVRAAVDRRT